MMSDIRDIKFPVEIRAGYIWWLAAIFLAFLAVAVGIFLYRKYRRITAPPPPPVPPHVTALLELDRIKNIMPENGQEIKEYYINVSGIIRRYIENRFFIHAPEQTTEEFLAGLTAADSLNQNHKGLLGDFLAHCDLVKFARYGPTKEEIRGVYETARKFVEETKDEYPAPSGHPFLRKGEYNTPSPLQRGHPF